MRWGNVENVERLASLTTTPPIYRGWCGVAVRMALIRVWKNHGTLCPIPPLWQQSQQVIR